MIDHSAAFDEVIKGNRPPRGAHGRELFGVLSLALREDRDLIPRGWRCEIEPRFETNSKPDRVSRKDRGRWLGPGDHYDNLRDLESYITTGTQTNEESIVVEFREVEATNNRSEGEGKLLELLGSLKGMNDLICDDSPWVQFSNIDPNPLNIPQIPQIISDMPNKTRLEFLRAVAELGVSTTKAAKVRHEEISPGWWEEYATTGIEITKESESHDFSGVRLRRFLDPQRSWASLVVSIKFATGKTEVAGLLSGLSVGEGKPPIFIDGVSPVFL